MLKNEGIIEGVIEELKIFFDKCYGKLIHNNTPIKFVAFDEIAKEIEHLYNKGQKVKLGYKLFQMQNNRLKKMILKKDNWNENNNQYELTLRIIKIY